MAYPTTGPVIRFETDFVEKGEEVLRLRDRATRIFQKHLIMLEAELQGEALDVFREVTPEAAQNSWRHARGTLRRTTAIHAATGDQAFTSMGGVTGVAGVIDQFVIEVDQPAQNPYGVRYAPFVIHGHRTRNAEKPQPGGYPALRERLRASGKGWVEANDYPERGMRAMLPLVNAALDYHMRAALQETVDTSLSYYGDYY